ncbi:MAG: SMC family ATPase [Thaumarchaeota archaeon]|nr:SMC family ATPase [Nitrososphaerota archaeon]
MILNSLVLENIRSYAHEEVEFPRGITLFEGDIGSGKSTILMAIEFALFGLGSQKGESLLAKKADDGYAILEFTVDDQKYEIKRALKRKSAGVNQDPKNSYIKTNDEKEPLSPSELKQRILQILKFNEPGDARSESRIYRYAVYTPQEEMKKVLSDSKIRLETIRRAFGIEDYAIAAANAKDVAASIKNQVTRLEERFSDIAQLEKENKASENIVREINAKISQLDKERKYLESENILVEKKLKQLQKQKIEKVKLEGIRDKREEKIVDDESSIESTCIYIDDAKKELDEFKEKLDELSKIKKPTVKTVAQIKKEIEKFQKISDELVKSEGIISELSSSISKLSKVSGKNKNDMQKETISKEKTLENTLKTFEESGKEIDGLQKQKTKHETNIENLQEDIGKFAKLGAKCPVCEQKITVEHLKDLESERKTKLDKLNVELKKIVDSFFDTKKHHTKLSKEIDKLESEISENQKMIPQIEEFDEKSAKFAQIEAKIKELQAQNTISKEKFEYKSSEPVEYLSALKDALVEYENSLEMIAETKKHQEKTLKSISKYQNDLKSLEVNIAKNRKEIQSIEKQVKSFADIDDEINSTEQEFKENNEKITQVYALSASSKQNLGNEQEKISINKEKIAESEKWKVEHDKFSEYFEWLTIFFIPTISQIEKQVLLSILQSFNETYHRWYSILVEDPTKESRIDEDFTPIVIQDGYDQEIGYLSGGEKTSIALAYRLTLNSLMRKETESLKSNLLILDEPTDGFSKNQLGKIREVLDELKSQQIILVSHEKELEAYVDNIFQISKEDGVSKISRLN